MHAQPVPINWHPGLPIYASEAFLRTVANDCGWIGGVDETGTLRCILPFIVIRRPGLRVVRFQLDVTPIQREFSIGDERSFLNSAVEYLRTSGTDLIIPGSNAAVFRSYPDGAIAAPYATYVQDLRQPEDALMKAIHPTYRYNIRRALREGVEVKEGMEYLNVAYELISGTLRRSHQGFRKHEDFRSAVTALGSQVRILAAVHNGELQGCMVAPYSQHTAYTWYCGSKAEPTIGAMHLLHWEAMCRFRAAGVQRFNFQGVRIDPAKGSKQEGIRTFKSRFGGNLVSGYVWKYSFRPLKFAAYSVAVRLLKGGDIVDTEAHKLRVSAIQ